MRYEILTIRFILTSHISHLKKNMYNSTEQKQLFELSKQLLVKAEGKSVPNKDIATAEVTDLHKVIFYHEWRYYVMDSPVIADYEYDHIFKYLEAIEAAYPDLVTPESPTQRVSSDLAESDLPSVEHLTPMLSLGNSYNAEDLQEFDERLRRAATLAEDLEVEYCIEPKFDGGTIALVYENDVLVRAATRGNGVKGEDITHNARAMRSIPLKAEFSKFGIQKVELRGEVLIRKDKFAKVNKKRAAEGETILANPRNAATGALRVKDSQEVVDRALEAFIYQVGFAVDAEGESVLLQLETHDGTIKLLETLGFKVPTHERGERTVTKNIADAAKFCTDWEIKREQYDYEIDGMVVKVNDLILQERTGYTSHHPRWAIAFKFKAKQATTKLLNIEYQVGKVGAITPVAKLEPVALAGVTISSVSLHNEDFITGKDLRLGDTVLVERAGDVIPYIVKSMEDLRDGTETVIEFPTHCPVCETKLERPETEAVWRCPNYNCEAQAIKRVIHHVSKDAMDIDGFGPSYVERFFEEGWVKDITDIYRLDYEAVANLDGFGKRSASKMKKAIDKAKQNPIRRLLYSLSVHHLGRKVSKLLAEEIEHVLDLKDWDEARFVNIRDVGPTVAKSVMAFFAIPENVELIKTLESLGVNVKQTEADKREVPITEGAFVGKTILFTGKLLQMSRNEAKMKAKAIGAKLVSGVSGKLDILVVGEKAGSKLKKAQALGTVEIMTEAEFLERVDG